MKYSLAEFAHGKIAVSLNSEKELGRLVGRVVDEYCVVADDDMKFTPPCTIVEVDEYGYVNCYEEEHARYFDVPVVDLQDVDCEETVEIRIRVSGRETHAELIRNGKVVKHTMATCHPDDKPSLRIGATLAFERLWEREKNETKRYVRELVDWLATFGKWLEGAI